jgi:hypothetical protein
VTDFLDQKRAEITKRLHELKPLVDEFQRLEAAVAALAGLTSASASAADATTPARRGPGRPRGSRTTKRATAAATRRKAKATSAPSAPSAPAAAPTTAPRSTGRRPGRRRGSGARAAQTLELVQAQPKGITIPELASKMGIKQNYLYRVLPGLQKEGKVRKSGRTWYAKAA